MKVLHFLESSRFSGAENVVCQIIAMMKHYPEYEMVYCSRDGQIRQALNEREVTFVPMNELSIQAVRRVLKEQKPDIIHAHDMRASFIVACCCGDVPIISHIHNSAFNSRIISIKSIAYWFAAQKAKTIFWVSQSAYEGYCFHKFFRKKSAVLYNIISINALYERMQEDNNEYPYDVVFVGRLTYPKNPQRLVQVLAKAVQRKHDLRVAIVGHGDLADETLQLCQELEITKNVSFLGFQNNPLKILHDAKLMLMTSRWEGLPMCALEALALGVPIVSTPTDGMKELLEDGKNGFLSDADEILAERMIQLVTDLRLRNMMSKYAREKSILANDTDEYCRRLIEAYEK